MSRYSLEPKATGEQALPPPDFPPELDPPVFPRDEVSPQPIADGADGMDVNAGKVGGGPEPMTIDRVDEGSEGEGSEKEEGDAWLNNLILQTQADVWNTFCLRESGCVFPVGEGNGDFFVEDFGGQKVQVDIPESSFDELTGAALDFEQVKQGMKTEVQQLERLKVGRCLVERDGRALQGRPCHMKPKTRCHNDPQNKPFPAWPLQPPTQPSLAALL